MGSNPKTAEGQSTSQQFRLRELRLVKPLL